MNEYQDAYEYAVEMGMVEEYHHREIRKRETQPQYVGFPEYYRFPDKPDGQAETDGITVFWHQIAENDFAVFFPSPRRGWRATVIRLSSLDPDVYHNIERF